MQSDISSSPGAASGSPHDVDITAALASPTADPASVAHALGLTLAQLALRLRSDDTQAAIEALHELFVVCAELGVARTRAAAAAKLEHLVRDSAGVDATPEQTRRLLIDVLKLADQRARRAGLAKSIDDITPPALSDQDAASLRSTLEAAALDEPPEAQA